MFYGVFWHHVHFEVPIGQSFSVTFQPHFLKGGLILVIYFAKLKQYYRPHSCLRLRFTCIGRHACYFNVRVSLPTMLAQLRMTDVFYCCKNNSSKLILGLI